MDEKEMVRNLNEKGVLVTPEMMEKIRKGENAIPEEAHKTTPRPKNPKKSKLSVKITKPSSMERLTPDDFRSYYTNRYNALRDILLKKMDIVSINKIKDAGKNASIIGMVRERVAGGFMLEDTTGEVEVISRDKVDEDDVIGVVGEVKEGKLAQSQMIWPDVPLTNAPVMMDGMNLLFADSMDSGIGSMLDGFDLVFLTCGGNETGKDATSKVIICKDTPCHIEISHGGKALNIMIHKPKEAPNRDDVLGYLRKRHLSPDKHEIRSTSDPFFIDPVPDILWVIGSMRHMERYKGVTMIISNPGDAFKYDSGTGEAFFAQDPAKKQDTLQK